MANFQTNQVVDYPVFNALIPSEGPKVMTFAFDFTAATSYNVDLTNLQDVRKFSAAQSVFIDNSKGTAAVILTIAGSGQQLTMGPGFQGYLPVLVPNPIRFLVSSNGNSATGVVVDLLNIPIPALVWNATGGANTYSGGKLLVSDAALDGAISGSNVNTLLNRVGSGTTVYPDWMGNLSLLGSIAATASAVITGAPGYYLTGAVFTLSPTAAQAAAGDWTVTLTDSATGAIYQAVFYVPATAPTLTAAAAVQHQTPGRFLWNNKQANSTLAVTLSSALTSGHLKYVLSYGQTGIVG